MEFYSQRIQKAISLATKVHWFDDNQYRKGDGSPFITHPLTIALILARVDADEDTLIAGILHDVVEDRTNDEINLEIIEKMLGSNVAKILSDLTEPDKNKFSWEERKKHTLEGIDTLRKESLLIRSADLLHNLSQDISRFRTEGKTFFDKFNAPMEKQRNQFLLLHEALKKAWPENPLIPELEKCVEQIKIEWN